MKAQPRMTTKWLVMLCACVAWTSGCFTRRTPARPTIGVVGSVRPIIPAEIATAELEPAPSVETEVPASPLLLAVGHSTPPKPRVAVAPTQEAPPAEKPDEPILAPEVATEELTAARAETQRSLELVEKNLTLAWGRTLNSTQQDLLSKVQGFTKNAQAAIKIGDWVRAKTLSKKAEVLSGQLADSL